jgi:hypothetical protein
MYDKMTKYGSNETYYALLKYIQGNKKDDTLFYIKRTIPQMFIRTFNGIKNEFENRNY